MHTKKIAALTLAAALLTGCAGTRAAVVPARGSVPPAVPAASDRADLALSGFGAALLKGTAAEGENTLVSPLSALLALAMTANGASGETLTALLEVLGDGCPLEELNASCASLLEDYAALGGGTRCTIADSLWLDNGLETEPDFVGRLEETYQAQVYQADLGAQAAFDRVNQWVKEQTRGLIPAIVDRPNPGRRLAALLVNALYLKNSWAGPFDPRDTWDGDFYPAGGGSTPVSFLCNDIREEIYIAADREQGVVLPYDDGRLAFVALMPNEGGLADYVNQMDGETLTGLVEGARKTRVFLRLPKFEAEWGGSLAEVLKGMGLETAFDPERADFSGMGVMENGDPLYIGDVIHKTRIAVNEKGTEAAAVTAVVMDAGAAVPPQDYKTLVFDHPFLYGIVDLDRGVPLFLGTFEQP